MIGEYYSCDIFNFVNTVHDRTAKEGFDYINSYQNFLDWCRKVELLSKEEVSKFRQTAIVNPIIAQDAIERIVLARETAFLFFEALINGNDQDSKVLKSFNKLISKSLSQYSFDTKCNCICPTSSDDLLSPVHLIFVNAYEVIKYSSRDRIKICLACKWLFLDSTKNGKRKWCSSLTCGSTDKSKRYYHRNKAQKVLKK